MASMADQENRRRNCRTKPVVSHCQGFLLLFSRVKTATSSTHRVDVPKPPVALMIAWRGADSSGPRPGLHRIIQRGPPVFLAFPS